MTRSGGFATIDVEQMHGASLLVPDMLMFIGGGSASAAGGIKVTRLRIGAAHAYRALRAMRRPRAVLHVRYGKGVVPEPLVELVAGFMVVFGMFAVLGTLLVAALGTDLVTAFTGVISALGNMGPAFGEAGPTASIVDGYSTPARLVLRAAPAAGLGRWWRTVRARCASPTGGHPDRRWGGRWQRR